MAKQEDRSKATRKAIVEAAYAAFEESGAPDVALEVIAERAGVTKGAIHYHFGNRAGLLAAIAIWVFIGIERRVGRLDQAGPKEASASLYIRGLLNEQASPVGRVLFTLGDEMARSGGLHAADPYKYLCTRLREFGVDGSVEVMAAAVMQLGRQLAFGLAEASEIDGMLESLNEGASLSTPKCVDSEESG